MGTTITPAYLLEVLLWSALATLGFAIFFNVPRRLLLACVVCGACGHVLRQLCLYGLGWALEVSTLAGALVVGFMGFAIARRLGAPAIIFQVAASISLVPGAYAYQAILAFIRVPGAEAVIAGPAPFEVAVTYFIRTALILAAIGAGIAAPGLLFQRREPIRD